MKFVHCLIKKDKQKLCNALFFTKLYLILFYKNKQQQWKRFVCRDVKSMRFGKDFVELDVADANCITKIETLKYVKGVVLSLIGHKVCEFTDFILYG